MADQDPVPYQGLDLFPDLNNATTYVSIDGSYQDGETVLEQARDRRTVTLFIPTPSIAMPIAIVSDEYRLADNGVEQNSSVEVDDRHSRQRSASPARSGDLLCLTIQRKVKPQTSKKNKEPQIVSSWHAPLRSTKNNSL